MKLRFHPIFICLAFVLIITGMGFEMFVYTCVVCLHELAHYLVAKKLGYTLNKLYLLPYGVCLSYKSECFTPEDEIYIALAGPISNALLCIIFIALWWIFPCTYEFTMFACFASFVTFIYNLLPVYPLDGGRVLSAIFKVKFKKELGKKIIKIINIIFSIIFFLIFLISIFYRINFNYLMISIIILTGLIETNFESKYELINHKMRKKQLKKGVKVNIKAFSSDTYLYKIYSSINHYKINYFVIKFDNGEKEKVINEETLEKILIKYGAKSTFNDILLK